MFEAVCSDRIQQFDDEESDEEDEDENNDSSSTWVDKDISLSSPMDHHNRWVWFSLRLHACMHAMALWVGGVSVVVVICAPSPSLCPFPVQVAMKMNFVAGANFQLVTGTSRNT